MTEIELRLGLLAVARDLPDLDSVRSLLSGPTGVLASRCPGNRKAALCRSLGDRRRPGSVVERGWSSRHYHRRGRTLGTINR